MVFYKRYNWRDYWKKKKRGGRRRTGMMAWNEVVLGPRTRNGWLGIEVLSKDNCIETCGNIQDEIVNWCRSSTKYLVNFVRILEASRNDSLNRTTVQLNVTVLWWCLYKYERNMLLSYQSDTFAGNIFVPLYCLLFLVLIRKFWPNTFVRVISSLLLQL